MLGITQVAVEYKSNSDLCHRKERLRQIAIYERCALPAIFAYGLLSGVFARSPVLMLLWILLPLLILQLHL